MSNKIYVIGDLHGSYKPIKNFYEKYKDNPKFNFDGTDTIILLGDAGLNYYFDHRDDNFKNALCKYPFNYFIVRGNHEQRPSICMEIFPQKWAVENFWGNTVYIEKRRPKIKYALDIPSEYYIPTKIYYGGTCICCKTLIIPGAYSVDKEYRQMMGWNWFPQEQLSYDEILNAEKFTKGYYDLILSHTCPQKYEPVDLFLPMIDQSKVDKTMENFLDYVDDKINYNLWLWGHYHAFRYYEADKWNRRRLMLYNQEVIELNDWLNAEAQGEVL